MMKVADLIHTGKKGAIPFKPKKFSRLTYTQEVRLSLLAQNNNVEARDKLILANIGLVYTIATQFCRPPIKMEDLVQEGILGLIRAIELFSADFNVRFSTYSAYWIRAKIQRFVFKAKQHDTTQAKPNEPISTEISAKPKHSSSSQYNISLDNLEENRKDSLEFIASNQINPETIALQNERTESVQRVLTDIAKSQKDPRMLKIIEHRLLVDAPEPLADLARRIKMSREGTRLLEIKLLRLAKQRLAHLK